jgi:hypothetical protein
MGKGIFGIRAEIRITAESETAARSLINEQHIAHEHCSWKKNPAGPGGHLYIGGELGVDDGTKCFLFLGRAKSD